jgi:hypothetical protein
MFGNSNLKREDFKAMADVGSGSWLTPALALALLMPLVALLTPILNAFLPRLWQDDLQRLRSVSETRVKRLEALEKALSVTSTAKAELGIGVTIHDLQRDLQEIVHEFAGPVVLSREELEKWASRPLSERLFSRPSFTDPAESVRNYRLNIMLSRLFLACFVLYYPLLFIINNLFPGFILKLVEKLEYIYPIPRGMSVLILSLLIPLYFIVLSFGGVVGRYRIANRAHRKLCAMPESGGVEEKKDSLAAQTLTDTKVCLKGPVEEPQRSVTIRDTADLS